MVRSILQETLTAVRHDIESARAVRSNLMNASQFEKDKSPRLVVRASIMHRIAKDHFRTIEGLGKTDILGACDTLLSFESSDTNVVAVDWATSVRRQYDENELPRFEQWLREYVRGWGMCDALCCGPVGMLFCDLPKLAPRVRKWITSRNLWFRRAAAVSLIPSVRDKKSWELAIEIADALLLDAEDYVQKGYGWLLKEASKKHQREVFEFVLMRKDRMPRTALRYAIEKMPQSMRQEAMRRE